MADIVRVEKVDEVYIKVLTDSSLRQELVDYFSFRPHGYQFVPSFKNRIWDGYIRLFNPTKPYLYGGLLEYLKKFCEDRQYEIQIAPELIPDNKIEDSYVEELATDIGAKLKPRDYQIDYVLNALRNNRTLSLSPTSCLDPKTIVKLDLDDEAYEFLQKIRK